MPSDPVSEYTEYAWASFLFGLSACGATGIQDSPDFAIMRKSCKRCLKTQHFLQGTRHLLDTLNLLVPHKHRLHEVVQRLDTLENAVAKKEDDAQKKLDQYKAQRLQFVSQLQEVGATVRSIQEGKAPGDTDSSKESHGGGS
ncbi:hypothetical protein C8J56DRAFT_1054090 [Mycena floridula]|nr:hypothetical protein C8J56DRAFT_1054090 [Mycena floridula]